MLREHSRQARHTLSAIDSRRVCRVGTTHPRALTAHLRSLASTPPPPQAAIRASTQVSNGGAPEMDHLNSLSVLSYKRGALAIRVLPLPPTVHGR